MMNSSPDNRALKRAAHFRSIKTVARDTVLPLIALTCAAALCVAPAFARTPAVTGQDYTTNVINPVTETPELEFRSFFVGTDSNLYSMTYPYNTGMWSKVTGSNSRPAVAAGSGVVSSINELLSAQEMFYLITRPGGATHVERSFTSSYFPSDLSEQSHTAVPALPSPVSALVAFSDVCAGTDNVFYAGIDRHIHVLIWSAGHPWKHEDLTLSGGGHKVDSNLITGHESNASEEIFYIGSNGHIETLSRMSGCAGLPAFNGWHENDLTVQAPGAPLPVSGSSLAGFYDAAALRDAVFYLDHNQQVQELYRPVSDPISGFWDRADLTTAAGAPAAIPESPLVSQVHGVAVFAIQEEVSFFDAGGNIWQFTSSPASNVSMWAVGEPSAGFRPAVVGSPLFTDVNQSICFIGCENGDFADEYYYIAEVRNTHKELHIQKLSIVPNQAVAWSSTDITATTGAPDPAL
jgi:hypothetical protein